MVLSPLKLWENYDRSLLPLDVSEISSHETSVGKETRVYFNGEATAAGCTRIYARCVSPSSPTDKAVVVMLALEQNIDDVDLSRFVEKGWAAIAVDYAGDSFNRARFTIYPASLSFANYDKEKLFSEIENPQKTCWYIWTTVCMRAFTYAESIGYTKAAAVGVGFGATHVFKATAVSEFPVCAVSVFSPEFFPQSDNPDFLSISVSLDITGYAHLLKVPYLQLCCSNDPSLDKVNELCYISSEKDLLSLTTHIEKYKKELIYIAPRVDKVYTEEFASDLDFFISSYFDDKYRDNYSEYGIVPQVTFSVSGEENKMYFSVNCAEKPKKIELYVSHAIENPAFRNWRSIPVERVGESEYIGYTEVYSETKPVYGFASITTESGFTFSTQLIKKIPSSLKIVPSKIAKKRLIYDSDMGIDDFFCAESNTKPGMKEGPFGISGICASKGLCTYKLGDVVFSGSPDGVLQLLLFSPVTQNVTFTVTDGELFNTYSCTKSVSPDTDWTKIMLSISDLKSNEGTLTGWDKAIFLRIDANEEIIISSLLWV